MPIREFLRSSHLLIRTDDLEGSKYNSKGRKGVTMRRRLSLIVFSSCMIIPLTGAAFTGRSSLPRQSLANAKGLSVSVSLVGRLIGAGNTLFITSVDVTNTTAGATQVDFYLDGVDMTTQEPLALNGSIDGSGAVVAQGVGAMRGRQNAHFDDFIDVLVKANRLPASIEPDGFIGSVLFVFNGFTKRGQGTATARFSNTFGGGMVGVSLRGHEISTNEPQSLVAVMRDTRGGSGSQTYANLFINNTGLTPNGGAGGTITVQITAYANSSGLPIGKTITIDNLGPGQTASISNLLQALGVAAPEDTVVVYATVTSGTSAIEGLVSQVDAVTKDGAAFEMSRADF